MKIFLSTIGRRGYMCDYFKEYQKDLIIYGSSNDENTSGFNFCDKNVILPDIKRENYFDIFFSLMKSEKINGLLSFFDQDVHLLSSHRKDLLENGIIPLLPDKNVADICFDKWATHNFLIDSGFLSPISFIDVNECLKAIVANQLNFPVIIKPRKGFASKGIYICKNEIELIFFANYINEPFIIQEIIDGVEHSFDILNDLNKNTISIVVKKKLMMRSGETDMSVTVKSDLLLETGLNLSSKLGNIGPLDVDFFIRDNGQIVILEMNPRFGGGYPGSHLAGANFPAKILRILDGENVKPDIGNYVENTFMFKDIRLTSKNFKIDFRF